MASWSRRNCDRCQDCERDHQGHGRALFAGRQAHHGRADKGFDAADFVVQNTTNRLSAGDTPTRHCGYEISQQKRKRVKLIPLMSSGWHAPPPIGAMPDLRATGPLSAEMLHWGGLDGLVLSSSKLKGFRV